MTEYSEKSLLNGSSGFISYEESSTSDFSFSESVDYSYQNRKNEKKLLRKNGSARKRQSSNLRSREDDKNSTLNGLTAPTQLESRLPDASFTFNGRPVSEETLRVVRYYRSFGDFWNKFPKTDYVYSKSSKWYGTEVAPGIPIIPNMSRRSYRTTPVTSLPSYQTAAGTNTTVTASEVSSVHSSCEYEESIITRIVRIFRRTVTITVRTTVRTVHSASSYLLSAVSTSSSGSSQQSSCRILPWLFLLLLLLTPLLYYTFYGTDPPVQNFGHLPSFNEALESTYDTVTILSSPYVRLWAGTVWLGSRFFSTLSMIPTLFFQPFSHLLQNVSGPAGPPAPSPSPAAATSYTTDQHMKKIIALVEGRVQELAKELRNKQEDSVDSTLVSFKTKLEELEEKLGALDLNLMNLINEVIEQKLTVERIETQHQNLNKKQEDTAAALTSVMNRHEEIQLSNEGKNDVGVASDDIAGIVQALLDKYHADRIGKTDFALALNGGAIVNIRCTKPYNKRSGQYMWGFLTWGHTNPPDIIIKPGSMPGECWAFEGANGYVVIELAIPIYVTGFSMEHAPKELTPFGHIKSAPRKFSVWGLESEDDHEEKFLGRFEFLDNGQTLQSFDAVVVDKPYVYVELRIESNHGELEYTCLYRFRIHGRPSL